MRLFDFYTSVIVVAHHMIGGVVGTEMVFHGGLRMLYGYVFVFVVSCQLGNVEQQVQIHHIVNDDREVPFAEIP